MVWLREQFGAGPIRRGPLDPTSTLLPKKWDGSCEAGADLFQRLCEFMLVDPARLHLQVYSKFESHELGSAYAGESHSSGPAGLYHHPKDSQKLVIALEASGLLRPAALAATICHELGHVYLLADQRIEQDEDDCEPLTDLLTVYFGAGILTANSAFQFSQWQDGRQQGWNVSSQGYLSEALFGFSLACFSWYRGDLEAAWRRQSLAMSLAALVLAAVPLTSLAPPFHTGLQGQCFLYISYGTPVEIEPGVWVGIGDLQLPVTASFTVLSARTGHEVARVTTDANGIYICHCIRAPTRWCRTH